ncbi:ABC transporter ATP-binding protein [Nocardioides sp. LHG3406-4]|uniref:ABC transporter ATP-binding protein n=1 Tax=Nocardioides sp. LHG3406-4 TaxID=2804575 RepID=UPI003CE67959
MAEILRVDSVAKSFAGVAAVTDASFEVEEHSITALIGPNGAGKTTTFNLVSGSLPVDQGSIRYDGRDITTRRAHQVARLGLMRTFQLPRVMVAMTVLDNLLLSSHRHPGERLLGLLRPGASRATEARARERAGELLERVGLAAKVDEYGGALSGGQRKLLELARLLMARPRMVLLDEPLAGVNPTLGLRLMELIHQIRDEDGTTFLFIEHDIGAVMRNADHVVVMAQGAVISRGTPAEVRQDPAVVDAYLGSKRTVTP